MGNVARTSLAHPLQNSAWALVECAFLSNSTQFYDVTNVQMGFAVTAADSRDSLKGRRGLQRRGCSLEQQARPALDPVGVVVLFATTPGVSKSFEKYEF